MSLMTEGPNVVGFRHSKLQEGVFSFSQFCIYTLEELKRRFFKILDKSIPDVYKRLKIVDSDENHLKLKSIKIILKSPQID